jgi:prenyltransferase beta subunit
MRKRCSKSDRLARLQESGGTPACEEAVVKSLRWLKANQNADGSWGKDTRAAMTGFVLLSYFGHCETPLSEEFGDSCMRGIVYLVNVGLKNEGKLSSNFTANHWSYEHAIATYALGEAATFCKQGKIEISSLMEVTEQAGQFIIDNQNKNGGWAYLYSKEGGHTDVSVAGWQIQALKACSHTNIEFRGMRSCINKGLDYLNRCQNENGGFGYTGTKVGETGYFTLTGVGMLCNQMWDKGTRPGVRKAASYILENTRFDYNTEFCDLYGHYYESQAMIQRGGDEWKRYNELFRDQLLDNQDLDGSWKTPGGGKKPRATAATWQGDKLYRTCLCTLMLEVYYRFLNTGGGTSERPQF